MQLFYHSKLGHIHFDTLRNNNHYIIIISNMYQGSRNFASAIQTWCLWKLCGITNIGGKRGLYV